RLARPVHCAASGGGGDVRYVRRMTWGFPSHSSRISHSTTFQTGLSAGFWTRRGWACQDKSVTQVTTSEASAKIDEMVRRIADRFQPERIILFGSQARGTARPDSDVDLLIVLAPNGAKRRTTV